MTSKTTTNAAVPTNNITITSMGFLRLPDVLKRVPVSRSTWWAGIKSGNYPKPVKLSTRTSAWLSADIEKLCEQLAARSAVIPDRHRPEYENSK